MTAPVTEQTETELSATLYRPEGKPLERVFRLKGNQPTAIMLTDLFHGLKDMSSQDTAIRIHAANNVKIAGTGFSFNASGHPSMATAFTLQSQKD